MLRPLSQTHLGAPLLVRNLASVSPLLVANGNKPLVAVMVAPPSALLLLATQAAQKFGTPPMPNLPSRGLLAAAFTAIAHTVLAGTATHTLLTLRRSGPPPMATPRGRPLTPTEELAGLMHQTRLSGL